MLTAQEKIALLKKQLSEKANKEKAAYPLSYGQRALFFLYMNSPESFAYNVAFTVRILSRLDIDALKKSFQKLINRHPSLRTSYKIFEGRPVQEVQGYKEIFFEVIDVPELDEEALKMKVKETNQIPFDLENGDLFKIYLFRISDGNLVLLLSMHHIVSDGWSLGIIFDELKSLYEAEINNYSITLPALRSQYSDYINSQEEFIKNENGEKQWSYWKDELSGELVNLNLPADKPRPAVQTFHGATEYFSLEKDLIDGLKKLSLSEGTTLFVTLLAAYQILLHKYTGQDDIVVGIPTAGRSQAEFENIIGYFINPAAVRGSVSDDPAFKTFLNQIKKKVFASISNQDLPFAVIVERLHLKRDPSRSPVFQTFFGLQKLQRNDVMQEMIVPGNTGVQINWGGLTLQSFDISQQEGQFDLTLELVEGKELFAGAFKYNTDLFEKTTVEQIAGHFKNLLKDILHKPGKKISEIQLLSEKEKNIILTEWNNSDITFEEFDSVHKLIEAQAKKTPDNVAVIFEKDSISYRELNKSSNQLANYLCKLGVKSGDLVGLCVERSIEMVVGILGTLKAGAAYVPIDPSYPLNRVEFMISDSNLKVLITQKSIIDDLPKNIPNVILTDEDRAKISNEDDNDPGIEVASDSLAYVIYTSGSTGTPKGVMITHEALSNHMLWMKHIFKPDSKDSVLQKTPFSFDASVWEFYLPLITGGKLVMAKPDGHMDTVYLIETIINYKITIIQLVPSLLKMLLNEPGIENCTSLTMVFSGGEVLNYDLKEKLFEKLNVKFYNLYGPTEATIDSIVYKCEKDSDDKIIPIGKPIYNTQAYILDKNLNPVAPGVSGELYLGGVAVAKGYINNPRLNKEKFIEDIFTIDHRKRLYKTGDLARYKRDGNIEYLGRIDHQVKLRGFRIEPGEIESRLLMHPEIKEATVIVREDKPGSQRLVGYLVYRNSRVIESNDLKKFLRESLPEYMVPSAFVELDYLPLTPNGKLDRERLPVPGVLTSSADDFMLPRLPVEEILSNIWKEILGLEKISINDNFFELGGDSIISIQIISKANQAGVKLSPRQIFQFQTIAELSAVIDYSAPAKIEQGLVTGEVILTPVQHWFFEQDFPEPDHFNHSVLLNVPKNLNEQYLKTAVEKIISQHDALRLAFKKDNSGWKQFNDDDKNEIPFSTDDFSGIDSNKLSDSIGNSISALQKSLRLEQGEIIKVRLFKTPAGNSDRLLTVVHHLGIDGISWRILLEDLYYSYDQLSRGKQISFPNKTTSYKEWSNTLHNFADSKLISEQKDYWVSLNSGDIQSIPSDNPYGENTAVSVETISAELDETNTHALLKEVPKAYNTQINDILLTALIISYYDWGNNNKLLLNLEGHGRENVSDNVDVSRTIGWFTSIYPVLLEAANPGDIGETLKSVKESLRQIPDNGIGFGLLKYLNRDENTKQLFKSFPKPDIVFNYLGQLNENISPESDWKLGKRLIVLDQNKNGMKYHKLEINSIISDRKLKMDFTFSRNIFNTATLEKFSNIYMNVLKNIIGHCVSSSGGYTPSDFSASGLNQQELDNLLANLN